MEVEGIEREVLMRRVKVKVKVRPASGMIKGEQDYVTRT